MPPQYDSVNDDIAATASIASEERIKELEHQLDQMRTQSAETERRFIELQTRSELKVNKTEAQFSKLQADNDILSTKNAKLKSELLKMTQE